MGNYTLMCALIPLIVLSMCQAESHSARLTAFGKSPSQNANAPPKKHTLAGRTRECKEDTECGSIQNTTCKADPRDGKMRCLCRDSSAPVNGACPNQPRAVRSTCTSDSQCTEEAECAHLPNSTVTTKMCLCREGFTENDGSCNAVRSTCTSDSQCTEEAECAHLPNSTVTTKMCLCREGFTENDGSCNDAMKLKSTYIAISWTSIVCLLWSRYSQ